MSISSGYDLLLLRVLVVVSGAVLCGALGQAVARVPSVTPVLLGERGARRAMARNHLAFVLLEPWLAKIAGIVRLVPVRRARAYSERSAAAAGFPLGLGADELLALNLLSMTLSGGLGALVMQAVEFDAMVLFPLLLVGLILPTLRLVSLGVQRAKALERSLPAAMDLCVLCMGAGADFPAALGFTTRELGAEHSVCREELRLVLEHLRLGRTRVQALEALSHRTRSECVRQFAAAVCQSEQKGTPLLEALTIQAATLRQRRSVRAEEMAAQASVRLIIPLMLMVSAVLLIVCAPFVLGGVGL